MSGLRYVYAICRPFAAALPSSLKGVAGAPPKQLTHHGLVAVLSMVPERDFGEEPLRAHLEDMDWLTETARAHQGVIDALTVVTTPLPSRLATVFRDDDGVRVMLDERQEHFRRALDRLEGRVEWGVKVYLASEPEDTGPPAQKTTSGRDYLRQRRGAVRTHEERWQKAEAYANRLHAVLAEHADDCRLRAPQNPALSGAAGRNVLNAAYLVPRGRSDAFVERVERTKEEDSGTRVEVTGPWAAYSFVEEA